jgi:2-dehydro-3-deoxyphosphooctonate aldolase (KDO 8-P synthase)
VDGLFLEVHPTPEAALCDGPNSLRLDRLAPLLEQVKAIDDVVRRHDARWGGPVDES